MDADLASIHSDLEQELVTEALSETNAGNHTSDAWIGITRDEAGKKHDHLLILRFDIRILLSGPREYGRNEMIKSLT
jgi:hypothetical protein